MLATRPKKTGADRLAAPARARVANPRQGDFAKPDCEIAGERPATRRRDNEIPQQKFRIRLAAFGERSATARASNAFLGVSLTFLPEILAVVGLFLAIGPARRRGHGGAMYLGDRRCGQVDGGRAAANQQPLAFFQAERLDERSPGGLQHFRDGAEDYDLYCALQVLPHDADWRQILAPDTRGPLRHATATPRAAWIAGAPLDPYTVPNMCSWRDASSGSGTGTLGCKTTVFLIPMRLVAHDGWF